MEKALEILKHIEELYTAEPDFAKLDRMVEQNPERVAAWAEAFRNYDLSDVLAAIDDFWQYKSSKSKPSVAQITAILVAQKAKKDENQDLRHRILKCADELGDKYGVAARERYLTACQRNWPDVDLSGHEWEESPVLGEEKNHMTDYAMAFMQRDVKLGRNRYLLPVYQKTVRYIVEELLSREMPASEWRKLSLGERCEKAMALGLFNRFDEILVLACRKWYGKDYQYPSANMLQGGQNQGSGEKAVQRLASHYRVNEAEMASAAGL